MIDVTRFDDQLFDFLSGATALKADAPARQFFLYLGVEADAAVPYSVLRRWGGSIDYFPAPTANYQIETIGEDLPAMEQANLLYAALTDEQDRPLRNVALADFRIIGVRELQLPAILSRDDRGRASAIFNFKVEFNAN